MTEDIHDIPGWTENVRSDGVKVMGVGNRWIVAAGRGRTMIVCPCCAKPFTSAEVAKKTANVMWPLVPW